MYTLNIEQVITVAVMSLWLLFPIGMFVSVMRQQNDEVRPKIPKNEFTIKDNVIHVTPINSYSYDSDDIEDEDDSYYEDYDYAKIPKKDSHNENYHKQT